MKIIVQAGGFGSRLEGLTRNKPKCMVPVDNLPIIFHAFKKFPDEEFIIIADYKSDVLEKYLSAFAGDYKYQLIKSTKKGTVSGINTALKNLTEDESFMILWCDLILGENFKLPEKIDNYCGISKNFICRWSYKDNVFVKTPSYEDGVAGLFIFKNKNELTGLPEEGALVDWLKEQNKVFTRLDLADTYEIGTLLAYEQKENNKKRCRAFNTIEFTDTEVIKKPLGAYGEKIADDEISWYKHVKDLGFENIPNISSYRPLVMNRVTGKNLFEYDFLTMSQKKKIVESVIQAFNELHHLEAPQPVNLKSIEMNYITKTFERLEKVRKLIPFADQEYIRINHRYYKNVFFCKEEFVKELRSIFPDHFSLIHGDCTFSNIMFDTFNMKTVMIDPRGYFGETKFYGSEDYDWAKIYYSLVGNYDSFNRHKFTLDIRENEVELAIRSNNWEDMEEYFFDCLKNVSKKTIKLLHAVIWLSLTSYAWEDYDSICGAFYNGLIKLDEALEL